MDDEHFEDETGEAYQGVRMDVYLASVIEDASRSFVKKLIKDGLVQVNGNVCLRPGRTMDAGDVVRVAVPPPPDVMPVPENIPLEILHEDADLVVVNKPSGLTVHPAPGHPTGTLVNAVLHHCPDFQHPGEDVTRPGIVHRLDQYTSGVMVVAKSPLGFLKLAEQAREHTFDRQYVALARGEFAEASGRISAMIGRSLTDRKRMSVTGVGGREAVTCFDVLERFAVASYIALRLETGRTHQIRVHMRFAGHPILGDPTYGVTDFSSWNVPEPLLAALKALQGQALHAGRLGFVHPRSGKTLTFTAPPPSDFTTALEELRKIAPAR